MLPRFQNNYSYVNKVKYDYFLLQNNGQITKFSGKKRDLLGIMKDKNDMIKAYFTKNRLNLKKMSHLAQIINYYNAI